MVNIKPTAYNDFVSLIGKKKTISDLEYMKQNLVHNFPKEAKESLTKLINEREETVIRTGDAFKEPNLNATKFWYGKDLINKPPLKYASVHPFSGGTYNTKLVKNIPTKN